MKTKSGDFVLPGDPLGVTEEFVPSEWTYEEEGKIDPLLQELYLWTIKTRRYQ